MSTNNTSKVEELDHIVDEIQRIYRIDGRLATTENVIVREKAKALIAAATLAAQREARIDELKHLDAEIHSGKSLTVDALDDYVMDRQAALPPAQPEAGIEYKSVCLPEPELTPWGRHVMNSVRTLHRHNEACALGYGLNVSEAGEKPR